ncbi:hypothetical protein Gohar_026596, partial [Gossypium harknessii]|nr:hypothetical protein [Gossypium harknessii]
MAYDKELAAAIKAASLAARLCRKVQKALLQSDVRSKHGRNKSPVTVADYGSQALVSFVLQQEFPGEFSLVAEEVKISSFSEKWLQVGVIIGGYPICPYLKGVYGLRESIKVGWIFTFMEEVTGFQKYYSFIMDTNYRVM